MSGSREELERNMMAVHGGIGEIWEARRKHVFLSFEDPIVFGAGHYVFYPREGDSPRLVITEQYTDTDWSDDERVPTSWTWETEKRTTGPDPDYPWETLSEGEIASADYQQLLDIVEAWVSSTYQLAEREASLTAESITRDAVEGPGQGRTFLA